MVYQIFGRELLRVLYLFLGIGLVSFLPLFFSAQGIIWPASRTWAEALNPLTNLQHLTYVHPDSGVERDLFPFVFKPFTLSITVFISAWALAVGSSFLLSLGLQYVSHRGKKAIVLPVLILAIVPTIYLLHALMESIENEAAELYVEFARSKGLSKGPLLWRHILRNTLLSVAYRSKYVVSMLVSNLLIVEYLFENAGMTQFLFSFTQPSVFLVTAVLFFLPIYLLLKVVEGSTYLITDQSVRL